MRLSETRKQSAFWKLRKAPFLGSSKLKFILVLFQRLPASHIESEPAQVVGNAMTAKVWFFWI